MLPSSTTSGAISAAACAESRELVRQLADRILDREPSLIGELSHHLCESLPACGLRSATHATRAARPLLEGDRIVARQDSAEGPEPFGQGSGPVGEHREVAEHGHSPCPSISRKSSSLLGGVRVHGAFGSSRLLCDLRQGRGRVSLLLEKPIGGNQELGSGLRFRSSRVSRVVMAASYRLTYHRYRDTDSM